MTTTKTNIGADVARWHELQRQIDAIAAELPKRKEWLSRMLRILPKGQDALAEYQDAHEAAGIGETIDWLTAVRAEQDQIAKRLLAAWPQSLAEALALVGIGFKLRKIRLSEGWRVILSLAMGYIAYRIWQFVMVAMMGTPSVAEFEFELTWASVADAAIPFVVFFAVIYSWMVLERLFGSEDPYN